MAKAVPNYPNFRKVTFELHLMRNLNVSRNEITTKCSGIILIYVE